MRFFIKYELLTNRWTRDASLEEERPGERDTFLLVFHSGESRT